MKMNVILFLSLLFIINTCLAESNNNQTKIKRDSAGGECAYINSFIGQETSYDCCFYEGIVCENNHIKRL